MRQPDETKAKCKVYSNLPDIQVTSVEDGAQRERCRDQHLVDKHHKVAAEFDNVLVVPLLDGPLWQEQAHALVMLVQEGENQDVDDDLGHDEHDTDGYDQPGLVGGLEALVVKQDVLQYVGPAQAEVDDGVVGLDRDGP